MRLEDNLGVVKPQTANAKPSANVANASPGLYATAFKTGLSEDEKTIIDNWAFIQQKHKELMAMPNNDAVTQFDNLEPAIQDALRGYFDADYANKPPADGLFMKAAKLVGRGIRETVGQPFEIGLNLAETYGKAMMMPVKLGMLAQEGQIGNPLDISRERYDEIYNGVNLFDKSETQRLIAKHGGAKSFFAMKILSGMSMGEAIQAWGPKDDQFFLDIQDFVSNEEEFNATVQEFKNAQLNPGNAIARGYMRNYKMLPEDNPELFKRVSGFSNFAATFFLDPLTFLTGGGTKASGKAAEAVNTMKKYGTFTVDEFFAIPAFQKKWVDASANLKEIVDARALKNPKAEADARLKFRENFPEYDNESFIELLTNKDNPVTDLREAIDFFRNAENTSKLISLRVNGLEYMTENAAEMRRSRNLATGIRSKTLDNLIEESIKLGEAIDNTGDIKVVQDIVEKNKQTKLTKFVNSFSMRYPTDKPVYISDQRYAESLDILREQAMVAVQDRRLAEAYVVAFANATVAERVALRKSLDLMTYDRMGLNATIEGQEYVKTMIKARYGDQSMSASDKLVVPARFTGTGVMDEVIEVSGPLFAPQATSALGPVDLRNAQQFAAKVKLDSIRQATAGSKAARLIGGVVYSKSVENYVKLWTTATLAPRLGLRTAIDEAIFAMAWADPNVFVEYLNAKRMGNIISAYKDTEDISGPLKSLIQRSINKFSKRTIGAPNYIPKDVRLKVWDEVNDLAKQGIIKEKDIVREGKKRILDMAMQRYGTMFDQDEIRYVEDLVLNHTNAFADASAGRMADVALGNASRVLGDAPILKDSEYTVMLNQLGYEEGQYVARNTNDLTTKQLQAAMFNNLRLVLATRPFPLKNGTNLNLGELFMKHDGLRTTTDFDNAVTEYMKKIGFDVVGGKFVANDMDTIMDFLSLSRQTSRELGSRGVDEIAFDFARAQFSDLAARFHGGPNEFNDDLLNHFKNNVNNNGVPFTESKTMQDLSFDEYAKLTENHIAKGIINTPLEFEPTSSFNSKLDKMQEKIFEWMSRTTDDILRQPIVSATYLMMRRRYATLESQLRLQHYQNFLAAANQAGINITPKVEEAIAIRAGKIASSYFANQAIDDAVNLVLKYSDNPNVRTMFAQNVRTIGRFYRATEDFMRRMYRVGKNHGPQFVYRFRLMQQGLAASGNIYEDQNGDSYVILPMDDAIFGAVDTGLRALTNDKLSVGSPDFSLPFDTAIKLKGAAPSFQDDAGIPYLSGPIASISVIGVKAILGKFEPTNNMAEDLDNFALGQLGDNPTIINSLIPAGLRKVWSLLDYNEVTQQEASALNHAVSYHYANGKGIYPDDKKYIREDGTRDNALYQADLNEFRSNIQISTHNILWFRNFIGLLSPVQPSLKETKDLSEWSKLNGQTSPRQEFADIYDSVQEMYPDAEDHYELAIAMFIADNPGKLAYLPSETSDGVAIVKAYSNEMQNWIINNRKYVDDYGNAAMIFAPNTGAFNSGVYNWAKGAGFINSREFSAFLNDVAMQEMENAYYDLDDQEEKELALAIQPDDRRAIINDYKKRRNLMKMQTPALEDYINSGSRNKEKYEFLNNVIALSRDENIDIDPRARAYVEEAYKIFDGFMVFADSDYARNHYDPAELKHAKKLEVLNELETLASEDKSGIVKQLIRISFRGLMNSKSREADGTITME
jgi:hypothetical protein